jgi:hypothetical protein
VAEPSLERRIARLEATREIQNVMGRYSWWHTADMHRECMDLFALTTPGVRAEMMWGVYEGPAGIERLYPGWHTWMGEEARKGQMHMHTLTTPVIEVADDLRTAKATWISPGHETMSAAEGSGTPAEGAGTPAEGGGTARASWAWCKYGCDFVVEDGRWKIWHLHVYGIFFTPYEQSWAAPGDSSPVVDPPGFPAELGPDRPPTTRWMYGPDQVYINEPPPPAPYSTFDESSAF